MWTPKYIHFQNLLSHEDSEVTFSNGACTVVSGVNNCDRGLENNGSGKSVLFDAISLALTNATLREDINKDKETFISYDAESCTVIFELENAALKSMLKIQRQFFRGSKPVKVTIWENGKQNTQITSASAADKRILELIGISREDLLRYYIIGQDNRFTFFKANDQDKKEVMNRITSADMINPVLEQLAQQKKVLQAKVDEQDGNIANVQYKVKLLQQQIDDTKAQMSETDEIQEKETLIKRLEQTNKQLNEKLAGRATNIESKQQELQEIPEQNVKQLKAEYEKLEDDLQKVRQEVNENHDTVDALRREVKKEVRCPHCGKRFIRDSELGLTPKQAKELLKEAQAEQTTLDDKEEKQVQLCSDKEKTIKYARIKNNERQDLQDSIKRLEKQQDEDTESINHNLRRIKLYKEKIAELKKQTADNTIIKNLKDKLSRAKQELQTITKEREAKAKQLDMVMFWNYNMGKAGFSTYLANKSIDIIGGITNTYLSRFDTDIKVTINGFKVLKSGEVRDKIDVFVSNDGITLIPFSGKSGGERARVTVAGILGIQHLINMSVSPLGLDLLVLDETLGATDRLGTMNIIETLNKMGVTILFVTQNIEDTTIYPHILIVEKDKDGVSHISPKF